CRWALDAPVGPTTVVVRACAQGLFASPGRHNQTVPQRSGAAAPCADFGAAAARPTLPAMFPHPTIATRAPIADSESSPLIRVSLETRDAASSVEGRTTQGR